MNRAAGAHLRDVWINNIVCGIDFSKPAAEARGVAVALAKELGALLRLVHVTGEPADDAAELLLAKEARTIGGLPIETIVRRGAPYEELAAIAGDAQLVVVASTGHRHGAHWLIGSTAERLVQASPAPVLVIRRADDLCQAIEKHRRARVVVATDLSPEAEVVIAWAAAWRENVPSDVHLSYVVNPPREYARLDIPGRIDRHEAHPTMEKVLTQELREAAAKFGQEGAEADFTMTLGATSHELLRVAEEQRADLVVVGAHQRHRLTRAWQESVAHGVLHGAHTNVAVIPLAGAA